MIASETDARNDSTLAVGIDPSSQKLHVAVLRFGPAQPKPQREYVELPIQGRSFDWFEQLRHTYGEFPVAIEGRGMLGEVAILELQSRGIDVLEVNPVRSEGARGLFGSRQEDPTDATAMAYAARFIPGLPRAQSTQTKSALKELTRVRAMIVEHKRASQNQLHKLLRQTYGAVYKKLFADVASARALKFFNDYPTINDALAHILTVRDKFGESVMRTLVEAGPFRVEQYLAAVGHAVRSLIGVLLDVKKHFGALERLISLTPSRSGFRGASRPEVPQSEELVVACNPRGACR